MADGGRPDWLVVDLDGTLVRTDTLHEQILRLIKLRPLLLLLATWHLLTRGKAAFKATIAAHADLDPAVLPYRQQVLDLIETHRSRGGRTMLASAAAGRIVESVAGHLKRFDRALGSDGSINLKGATKLKSIREAIGTATFAYVGDSKADLEVWRGADLAIAVSPSKPLEAGIKALNVPVEIVAERPRRAKLLAKQLRVHQWAKNFLIFVPVLAAHRLGDFSSFLDAGVAVIAFSLLASAVYVFNDILDLDSDRRHHSKRNRPFASGELPLSFAFVTLPALLAGSVFLASVLPRNFGLVLGLYVLLNLVYTFRFKEVVMLDVMILTSFYGLRIMAGGAASGVPVSHWLMSFGIFFFFGLALVKRFTEISRMADHGQAKVAGRGYVSGDKLPVYVIGVAASFMSILVTTLYFQSSTVVLLYRFQDRLWLLVPLLLYWNSRVWMTTWRGGMQDDPVLFALKDPPSWITGVCFLGVLWYAT